MTKQFIRHPATSDYQKRRLDKMATNNSLKNQLTEQKTQGIKAQSLGFKSLMATPTMKRKFQDILHEKSDSFMGSLLTLVGGITTFQMQNQ